MKLHHIACRVHDLVLAKELMELLGLELTYDPDPEWALFRQGETAVQLITTEEKVGNKIDSHLGFIDADPAEKIQMIDTWAKGKGLETLKGQWSEQELWIDIPGLLADFVIEVMDEKIL